MNLLSPNTRIENDSNKQIFSNERERDTNKLSSNKANKQCLK